MGVELQLSASLSANKSDDVILFVKMISPNNCKMRRTECTCTAQLKVPTPGPSVNACCPANKCTLFPKIFYMVTSQSVIKFI